MIKLELAVEQVNLLLVGLQLLQAQAGAVVSAIQQQAQAQLQPTQEAAE